MQALSATYVYDRAYSQTDKETATYHIRTDIAKRILYSPQVHPYPIYTHTVR